MYSGVYDDLPPADIPEDLSLFAVDEQKYPLLKQVEAYILKTRLHAGDCIYVPAYYWFQTKSASDLSVLLSFGYESHSRLTDLLFDAINDGILDK